MNQSEQALRAHVLYVLKGEGAHISFEDFIKDFPAARCGERVNGFPYTAWQVLEHMRIAQWDILEFSRNASHVSPVWPKGYWPRPAELGNETLWKESIENFRADLKQMEELIARPDIDLFAKIPHGNGQTILREALLVADHNAYHLGVLVALNRMLS